MDALVLNITNAGRAALVNAAHDGTRSVRVAAVGVSATATSPTAATTALPAEIKRIATISGTATDADTIHVTVRDESADSYAVRSLALYLDDGTLFAAYGQADALLEKSAQAMMLLALDVRFTDVSATQITFGNANFLNPAATTQTPGVVALATDAEAAALTEKLKALTPRGLAQVFTAANILSRLLTVDGAGSGLDADLLDGQDGAYYANVAARLGYTPANRAGDTFGGPLTAPRLTLTDAPLPIASGGTGATTVPAARTALGLGTMALERASDYATLASPIFSGNVGVGVEPNGAWKLHVGNASTAATYTAVGNNNGATILGVAASGVSQLACYSLGSAITIGTFALGSAFTEWARFASTGLTVQGTIAATGAITQAGNPVWHAGNFSPANYAALAGSPSFAGTVTGQSGMRAQSAGVGAAAPALGAMDWAKTGLFVSNNSSAYGLLAGVDGVTGSVWMQSQRTDGTATAYNLHLQPSGGNVGIGTTNATDRLTVAGNASVSGNVIVGGIVGATGNVNSVSNANVAQGFAFNSLYGAGSFKTNVGPASGLTLAYSWATGGQGPLYIVNGAGEVARFTPSGDFVEQNSIFAAQRVYAGAVNPNLGRVCLTVGTAQNSGYIEFFRADSTREAYMGFAPAGGPMQLHSENGAGYNFTGGPLKRAGNLVWDAANDGAGSGLDADLLDGYEGAAYDRVVASNLTENGGYLVYASGRKECWGRLTIAKDSYATWQLPVAHTSWVHPIATNSTDSGNVNVQQNTGIVSIDGAPPTSITWWNADDRTLTIWVRTIGV